jgi:hypothetical protein
MRDLEKVSSQSKPTNRQPALWVVAEKPVRLPNALIAAQSLRQLFPGGVRFVRDESPAWKRVQWQSYADYFDDVYTFPEIKSVRGLRDLPRFYRQTLGLKTNVAALPIDSDQDALLCIAGVLGLAAAAAAAHPNVFKVLSLSTASYQRLTRLPDRIWFRFTTSGWLQNRVIEPLAGVERTLHLKPRFGHGGDGTRLVRLQKDPADIFDVIITASISGHELPRPNGRFIATRYASVIELPEFSGARRSADRFGKVLFFGTPFLLVQNLEPELYVAHLDRCLAYIRRHYPGRDLIYRPHPFETAEAARLNLTGFRIENDREAAELHFLQHFAEIEAVYSVSSTVSRTALTSGLNAYSFWRCFPFSRTAAEFFEKLMGDVPLEFEITNLEEPPVEYQSRRTVDPATRSYGEALKIAMARRPLTRK